MFRISTLGIAFICFFLLNFGCDSSQNSNKTSKNKKIKIATSFYPTTEFTQRIGGEKVEVTCYLPEGEDPIFWKPPAKIIQNFQQSDLIILNGAEFEKWVGTASLPSKKVLSSAKSFKKKWVKFTNAVIHSHGSGGDHAHEGIDGHTWVSPEFAKLQAKAIAEALTKLRPDGKELFAKNYQSLIQDLDNLEARFKELGKIAKEKKLKFVASHPAYNYLVLSYGFNFKNFDFDPMEVPKEKSLKEFKTYIQQHKIKHLIWESQPTPEVAKVFKEKAGVDSIVFSPVEGLGMADKKAGKTFFSIMKTNIDNLAKIIQ